ncbi:protein of unknown function [Candidatus Nitrotoga arctica]|uniref:Uncharacterized protein n=1 Tax=Candidatus Nitrotoga arctica TaxID=453162 RepID=A0ABN8AMU3_9PROT|nr:hypothetical protein [Candidatus Nitrotoga arctica]CAG9934088.1 protein of unknown function [Candidatus Nitrotoga arctica]
MSDGVFFTPTLEQAFNQAGLPFPADVDLSLITRYSTNGNKTDKSGWLRHFPDGHGAVFRCWRGAVSFVWQHREEGSPGPTREQLKKAKEQAVIARKQAKAERDDLHVRTALSIEVKYAELPPATDKNAYCTRTVITPPDSVKQGAQRQLVIPVYDGEGTLNPFRTFPLMAESNLAKTPK